MAAVSNDNTYSDTPDEQWADPNLCAGNNYAKSKILAERAAWDYITSARSNGSQMELATILPTYVLGPALLNNWAVSHEIPSRLLTRQMPMVPDLSMGTVDVRDVASAHRRALEVKEAAGQRFVCWGQCTSFLELAKTMEATFDSLGYNIPTTELPYFLAWTISWFDAGLATILPRLGKPKTSVNNSKIQRVLGIQFHPENDTILAHAHSVVQLGIGGVTMTAKYREEREKKTS
jgi:dihydroflavonol-4-reductase